MDYLFEVLPEAVVLHGIVPLVGGDEVIQEHIKSGQELGPLMSVVAPKHIETAGRYGHMKVLEVLHGRASHRQRNKALCAAIEGGQDAAFEWLLQHGASPGARHNMAFVAAARGGRLDFCRRLFEQRGAGVNPAAKQNAALHAAAISGHVEICRWLLSLRDKRGKIIVDHTENNWLIPRYAALAKQLAIVELFAEYATLEGVIYLIKHIYDNVNRTFWRIMLFKLLPSLPKTTEDALWYIMNGFSYSRSIEWFDAVLTHAKTRNDFDDIIWYLISNYCLRNYDYMPYVVPHAPPHLLQATVLRCSNYVKIEFAKSGVDMSFDDNRIMHRALCDGKVELVKCLLELKQPGIDPFVHDAAGLKEVVKLAQEGIDIIRLIHYAGFDLTFDNQRLLECAIRVPGQPCVVALLMLQRNGKEIFCVTPWHVKLAKQCGASFLLLAALEQRLRR